MNRIENTLFGVLLLFFVAAPCFSQEGQTKDGVWLRSGVDAFNRIAAAEYLDTSSPDFRRAEELISYSEGILYVHRQNNLLASVVVVSLQEKNGKGAPVSSEAHMAFAFAPLLRVPDNMSRYQLIAILDKYLKDHPAEWSKPAGGIITEALRLAFEPDRE